MPSPAQEDGLEDDQEVNLDLLSAQQLEELARDHEQRGEFSRSLEILHYLQGSYPAYEHNDRVSYTRARLLEQPEIRDIKKSLSLYKEITELYPFSHYDHIAKERIRFIQRNIIRVF